MGNEEKKQAKAVNKQADKLFKEGLYSDAIKLYVESVKLAKFAGDLKLAENFQHELEKAVMKRSEQMNAEADAVLKNKDYQQAMEIYQKAYALLEKAGEKWLKKKGKVFENELLKAKELYASDLKNQAEDLIKQKDWNGAVKLYKEILRIISAKIDKRSHAKSKSQMKAVYERWADEINAEGDQLYKEEKYEEAIEKYTKSVSLINKSENTKKQKSFVKELAQTFAKHAQVVNDHGDKLMKEKRYQAAAEFYGESVNIAQQSQNEKLVKKFTAEMLRAYETYAKDINTRGDALFKSKKYEDAATLYKQSLEAAEISKDTKLIRNFKAEYEKAMGKWADLVNADGDAAMKAQKFDQAFKHYKQSVEIIKVTSDAKKIKKYQAEFLKACEKLAKELNGVGDQAAKEDDFEKAYNYYNKSVNLIEIVGDVRLLKKYTKERNKALAKLNE